MTAKESKELKERYQAMTLGELKGIYSEKLRISEYHKTQIREKAEQLANLDFDNKYYVSKAKNLMNDITFYKKDIQEDETDINLIKPILEKKEIEGINQAEYEAYIEGNTDIRILIKAVEEEKQKFIDTGHKVTIQLKKETKEIILPLEEVNQIYDTMLKELILMIKDNIGNITKVEELRSNGNRGMDGYFEGEKGRVYITTVMAGGYNIQKLHFRTLVYKR